MIDRAGAIDENLVVKHMEVISKYELLTNQLTNQLTGVGARDTYMHLKHDETLW